jgi:hypothetical protein
VWVSEPLHESGGKPAQQVKKQEADRPHSILHVVDENPKRPHVSDDVEPKRRDKSYTGEGLGALYRESFRQWQRIDVHFTQQLLEKTREIARRVIAEVEPER